MSPLDAVPWRLVGSLALTAALSGGVTWYTVHERGIGAAKCVAEGVKVVAKNDAKVAGQEAAAAVTGKQIGDTYADAIHQPVVAPVYRVQPQSCSSSARQVLPASSPGPAVGGASEHGAENPGQPPATWDSAPVVQAGHDADAQINGLLDYIERECKPKN